MKLWADWIRHYAAPVESYKYLCVVDLKVCVSIIELYNNALAFGFYTHKWVCPYKILLPVG